jgi:hypothetical protein
MADLAPLARFASSTHEIRPMEAYEGIRNPERESRERESREGGGGLGGNPPGTAALAALARFAASTDEMRHMEAWRFTKSYEGPERSEPGGFRGQPHRDGRFSSSLHLLVLFVRPS